MKVQHTNCDEAARKHPCVQRDHEIGKDYFMELPGCLRSVAGNAWCYTCKKPVALRLEIQP